MRAKAGRANQTPMLIDGGGKTRRPASSKWRELIKKVWEVDPLECPNCGGEMKTCPAQSWRGGIIALIDENEVIEKILRHLGLCIGYETARAPPDRQREPAVPGVAGGGYVYEPYTEDPFPDLSGVVMQTEPDYETFEDEIAAG